MFKIVFFMLMVYVVAIAGAFFIEGPDGKPIASIEKTKSLAIERLGFVKDVAGGLVDGAASIDYETGQHDRTGSGSTGVYRWKSEDGSSVYGDSPPKDSSAKLVEVDTESNILPSQSASLEEADALFSPDKNGLANIPVLGTVEATKNIKKQIGELEQQIQARETQMR